MKERILITGGAGFIGRHVSKALLARGYDVVVLDLFISQVHQTTDAITLDGVEVVRGDIRDRSVVEKAVRRADSVIHLAAEVGVGQSMYAIERYVGVNDTGTAVLFDVLSRAPVRRVVVASSMSIYGEGLYRTAGGCIRSDVERPAAGAAGWDPVDEAGHPLVPVATPEWKQPKLASVYALTKFMQERLTLMATAAYGMEGCALRLFNVFGPGQALSNPYTGVLAIFASRIANGRPPLVFEDGAQRRDFVHVEDVAEAFVLALEQKAAAGGVFNIASGRNYAVSEVARLLASVMGRPELEAQIIGKARVGDIRHCFADIEVARERLGFRPRRFLEDSLGELSDWVRTQQAIDRVSEARAELEVRGLVA